MRGTYWLMTRKGWRKAATLDAALELVDVGPGEQWQVFIAYGRQAPTLVRWDVGASDVA
jgi:hypothetical protein